MKDIVFKFQPIIIVGAGRSGTNMLRDMMTRISGVSTWPCDEINYIWRHYNASVPHDEFTREHAKPAAVRYIRGAFQRMASKTGCELLVEKTCANSLRIGFVDAVIPEAKYVFIVRDGRDVVLSAVKRWKAGFDAKYVLKKVPFVPLGDLSGYAFRYAWNRMHRMTSGEKRLSTWGPKFVGMRECLAERSLDEVCAMQWQQSVVRAAQCLADIPSDRIHTLRYEDIVQEPEATFDDLLSFLKRDVSPMQKNAIIDEIFADSVGVWKQKMPQEQLNRIEALIGPTLSRFGYESGDSICNPRAA